MLILWTTVASYSVSASTITLAVLLLSVMFCITPRI